MSLWKVVNLPVNARRFLKTRLKRAHKALDYDDANVTNEKFFKDFLTDFVKAWPLPACVKFKQRQHFSVYN